MVKQKSSSAVNLCLALNKLICVNRTRSKRLQHKQHFISNELYPPVVNRDRLSDVLDYLKGKNIQTHQKLHLKLSKGESFDSYAREHEKNKSGVVNSYKCCKPQTVCHIQNILFPWLTKELASTDINKLNIKGNKQPNFVRVPRAHYLTMRFVAILCFGSVQFYKN